MRVDLPPPCRGGVGWRLGPVVRPERAHDAQLLVVPVEDRAPALLLKVCGWVRGLRRRVRVCGRLLLFAQRLNAPVRRGLTTRSTSSCLSRIEHLLWDLRFGVWGSGFGVWGLGSGFGVWGLGFRG